MTFIEGMAGLQLIAEQGLGKPWREMQRREDASMDRSLDALRREQQEMV